MRVCSVVESKVHGVVLDWKKDKQLKNVLIKMTRWRKHERYRSDCTEQVCGGKRDVCCYVQPQQQQQRVFRRVTHLHAEAVDQEMKAGGGGESGAPSPHGAASPVRSYTLLSAQTSTESRLAQKHTSSAPVCTCTRTGAQAQRARPPVTDNINSSASSKSPAPRVQPSRAWVVRVILHFLLYFLPSF